MMLTLKLLGPALAKLHDSWWIIGSTALVLHGVSGVEAQDIDLLVSYSDACRLAAALDIKVMPGSHDDRFRSDLFGRWTSAPLHVEICAGLHVRTAVGWSLVAPNTREQISAAGLAVRVPSRAELRDIMLTFDRPKDHARVALLDDAG